MCHSGEKLRWIQKRVTSIDADEVENPTGTLEMDGGGGREHMFIDKREMINRHCIRASIHRQLPGCRHRRALSSEQ